MQCGRARDLPIPSKSCLFVAQFRELSVEAKTVTARFGFRTHAIDFSRWSEIAICRATREQALSVHLVTGQVGALIDDLLVPVEAKPLQSLEDGAGAFVGAALAIGVLDAKEENATKFPREQPVEEGGAGAADV